MPREVSRRDLLRADNQGSRQVAVERAHMAVGKHDHVETALRLDLEVLDDGTERERGVSVITALVSPASTVLLAKFSPE